MGNIKVFSLAFDDEQLSFIPKDKSVVPVQLSKLKLIDGIENNNQLSEARVFLSKKVDSYIYAYGSTEYNIEGPPEYVGFASWRFSDKFPQMPPITQWGNLNLQKDTVYIVVRQDNWYEHSSIHHAGMQKYLLEMAEFTGLKFWMPNGFVCNSFVCHRDVYSDFQLFFRKVFKYFNDKYGYAFDFFVIPGHRGRTAACLYERASALYFSNRTDLKILDLRQSAIGNMRIAQQSTPRAQPNSTGNSDPGVDKKAIQVEALLKEHCASPKPMSVAEAKLFLEKSGFQVKEVKRREDKKEFVDITMRSNFTGEHNGNERVEIILTITADVLEIITVFSARLYGSRSHKNKAIVAKLKEVASEIKCEA